MTEDLQKQLDKFYLKLYNYIQLDEKVKESSLLEKFLYTKLNKCYTFLKEASIESSNIPAKTLDELIDNNYVRATDRLGSYSMTAKGVWAVEMQRGAISIDGLINVLDDKFFNLFSNSKKITDKEKVVLLSFIAIRAFSAAASMDLKKGRTILDNLQEVINKAYDLLKKHQVVKNLKKEDLFGKGGNEHPVSNVVRHASPQLNIQTKGTFKVQNPQKYYLDIFDKTKEKTLSNLAFLIWVIYKDTMTIEMREELMDFCLACTYEKGIYIYDLQNQNFIKPEYDPLLREGLEEYIISSRIWKEE